jgi:hypothetical protein
MVTYENYFSLLEISNNLLLYESDGYTKIYNKFV